MEPLLLRPLEVAELLGISKSKVYELLASGALPSIRIGSSIRVPVAELKKWIAKQADWVDGEMRSDPFRNE